MIAGIDIGSTAIRVAAGHHTILPGGASEVRIVGAVEVPSIGVQKGVVTSIEETVSSLSNALEQMERLIGIPIEHAWVGISGAHVAHQHSKGVVAVAKSDGEISRDDVSRALAAAGTVAAPLNYEVLHVLPKSFSVDGQTGIRDPIGMTGIRLEADVELIHGAVPHIKNITKAVYRTGIDIDDLVLSILVTGDVVTTDRQKALGVAVVNIGGATTSMVVYEGGDMIHTALLPLGGDHMTNDIAIGLRIPVDVAERVKVLWGHCIARQFSKKDTVDLFDAGSEYHENISRAFIADIIEARVSEIFEKVDAELLRIGKSGLLPAGILFTGGGAKIAGLVELAKDRLRLPAGLGYPMHLSSVSDKSQDIACAGAVGLVRWASLLNNERGRALRSRWFDGGKWMEKVKDFAKSLIP